MTEEGSHPRVLQESIVHGAGVLISQFISAVRGLVIAGLLGEARYGLWKSVQVGLDYLAYTHVGVLHGMAREVPFCRKNGEVDKERAFRRTALLLTLATSTLAGLLLVLFTSGAERNLWYLWIGIAMLLVPNQLIRYLTWICLVDGRFALLSTCDILAASISFAVMWWSVPTWGVLGVLLGLGVGFLTAIGAGWIGGALSNGKDGRTCTNIADAAKKLVQTGFPFMFVDGLFVVWQRIDRVVLVTLFGAETRELGCYGLAVMVASFAIQIPQTLMRVLFRRTVKAFDRDPFANTESPQTLHKHLELPVLAVAATTPLAFGLGTVASWAVIRVFLPGYREAEASIAILMLACYWAGVGLALRNIYTATNRQWRLGCVYALSIATTVFVIYAAAWLDRGADTLGIMAGCLGMVMGSLVFGLLSLGDVCRHLRYTLTQFVFLLMKLTGFFLAFWLWTWFVVDRGALADVRTGLSIEELVFDAVGCLLVTGPVAAWFCLSLLRGNDSKGL